MRQTIEPMKGVMTNEPRLDTRHLSAIAELLSRLDSRTLEEVRTLPGAKSNKYLDVDQWFLTLWAQARELGLHDSSPLRILDIGTGPGYFPYICRSLGHDCIGLDQPDTTRPRAYARLCAWVGTEVVHHSIRPFEPLPPFTQKFALVTAIRAPFYNVKAERRLFTVAEWAFFLDDLRDNVLRPHGSFFLRMNKKSDYDFAGAGKGDPELTALLTSRGAKIEQNKKVYFAELL
jgi:hypothetical protein